MSCEARGATMAENFALASDPSGSALQIRNARIHPRDGHGCGMERSSAALRASERTLTPSSWNTANDSDCSSQVVEVDHRRFRHRLRDRTVRCRDAPGCEPLADLAGVSAERLPVGSLHRLRTFRIRLCVAG